jgi:hypothetical protein
MVASIGERKVRPTEPVEKSYGSYARTPLVSAAMTVLVRGVSWRYSRYLGLAIVVDLVDPVHDPTPDDDWLPE